MAAAFVVAVSVMPSLAAERNSDAVRDGSRSFDSQCDGIHAAKHGPGSAYIRYCENEQ